MTESSNIMSADLGYPNSSTFHLQFQLNVHFDGKIAFPRSGTDDGTEFC